MVVFAVGDTGDQRQADGVVGEAPVRIIYTIFNQMTSEN